MTTVFGVFKTDDGVILQNAPITVSAGGSTFGAQTTGTGYFEIELPTGLCKITSNTGKTLEFTIPSGVNAISVEECLNGQVSTVTSLDDLIPIFVEDSASKVGIEKIRTDLHEYRFFIPIKDGYYESWLFSERFYGDSGSFQTEPGLICSSLARIYAPGILKDIPLNTAYEQYDPNATYVSSGTETGTFINDSEGTRRTSTIGDRIAFSVTVTENGTTLLNRVLESTISGDIEYQITGSGAISWIVPLSGGKRLATTDIPSGTSRANLIPLAVVEAGTYTVTAIYDSNPASSTRVAIGGIHVVGPNDYKSQGILGKSLDGTLGDTEQLNRIGQKFIYLVPPCGQVVWRTYGNTTAGIAIARLYRQDGVLITEETIDLAALASGDVDVVIWDKPTTAATSLEIEVSPTTNSASSPPRTWIYTRGVEAGSSAAGEPKTGRIDLMGQAYSVASGNALGTSVLLSAGNIANPININNPGSGFNAAYFISGIHGYTNFQSLECYVDDQLQDIKNGAIGDRWQGEEIKLIITANTYFPASFSGTPVQSGRIRIEYKFTRELEIATTFTFLANTQIHIAYTHALGLAAPEDTNQDLMLGRANQYYVSGVNGILDASANRASQGDRDTQSGTESAKVIAYFGDEFGHVAELVNSDSLETLESEHTGMGPSEDRWILDYRYGLNGSSTKAYKKLRIPQSAGVLFAANSQLFFVSRHRTFLGSRLQEILSNA